MAEHIGWDAERLEFLWGLRQPSPRGPRPSLTTDQIVRAAIELADVEGLKAVSMKRVAERLGVGTMSLYTYVPDKASLLEAMLDTALGEAVLGLPSAGWRPHLEQSAHAIFDAYLRHPWGLEVFVGGPPIAPNQMTYLESALEALSGCPLSEEEKLQAIMSVSSYVRGSAHVAAGVMEVERASGRTPEEADTRYAEAYALALTPERFPLASALLTDPQREDPTADAGAGAGDDSSATGGFGFSFGLQRLLDGIESLIDQRQAYIN